MLYQTVSIHSKNQIMAIRKIKRKEIDNLMNDDKIKYKKPIKN